MNNITLDSFKEALYEFYNEPTEPNREFTVMMGVGARASFDHMCKQIAAEGIADTLKTKGLLSEEEHGNLNKMISSPDYENLIMAVAIMDQRRKHE